MNNQEIQEIIEQYVSLGNMISSESSKLKNKLEKNGLESTDLETLHEQIDVCIQSISIISDKLEPIMTNRNDSI